MRLGKNVHFRTLATVTLLAGVSSTVMASGFRVPEVSIAGLSTANALVANDKELGAIGYNPAAMSFHKGNNFVGGVVILNPSTSYTPPGGSSIDANTKDLFGIPNLYVMGELNDKWSWGLNINAPFGLETRWAKDTFPGFAGPIDGFEPELSKLQMVNYNPNASIKVGESTSIAFGIDFYQVKSLAFNTFSTTLGGSGDGLGFNFGIMSKINKWTLGLSYRSAVSTDLNGTFQPPAGSPPGTPASINVDTTLELPQLIQLGARYQVTEKVAIEFDIDHTGWSSFDKLEVKSSFNGQTVITTTNNWDDATAYRLGVTWDVTPATQLRFGYAFDETPQPDAFFSARIPDADRQLVSIGVAHKIDKWAIEAGYMYAFLDDRTVNSTRMPGADGDPNGTVLYNGKYKSDVNLLGLGVTYSF